TVAPRRLLFFRRSNRDPRLDWNISISRDAFGPPVLPLREQDQSSFAPQRYWLGTENPFSAQCANSCFICSSHHWGCRISGFCRAGPFMERKQNRRVRNCRDRHCLHPCNRNPISAPQGARSATTADCFPHLLVESTLTT